MMDAERHIHLDLEKPVYSQVNHNSRADVNIKEIMMKCRQPLPKPSIK